MATLREVSSNVDGFPRGKATLLQPLPTNANTNNSNATVLPLKSGSVGKSSGVSMVNSNMYLGAEGGMPPTSSSSVPPPPPPRPHTGSSLLSSHAAVEKSSVGVPGLRSSTRTDEEIAAVEIPPGTKWRVGLHQMKVNEEVRAGGIQRISSSSSRHSSQTRPSSVPPSQPHVASSSSASISYLSPSQPQGTPVPEALPMEPDRLDRYLRLIPYCPKLIDIITTTYLQREREAVRAFNEGTTSNTPNIVELHKYYASPHYLQFQPDITPKMRVILVDWLIDVHKRFDHHRETLFLTVNIIDRYLSVVNTKYAPYHGVRRSRLQLVAVAAYIIATKYEQIIVPDIKEFVLVAAHSYTKKEILTMESDICNALGFRFTVPTSYSFASRLLTVMEDSPIIRYAEQPQRCMEQLFHLTNFFLEHALLDYSALQFTPSQVGNAAMFLAIHSVVTNGLGGSPRGIAPQHDGATLADIWSPALREVSGASVQDFLGCAEGILHYVETIRTNKYQAVRHKYTSSRCAEVCKLNMPTSLPLV